MSRSHLPSVAAALLALLLFSAAVAEHGAPAGPLVDLMAMASPAPAGSAEPHLAASPDGAVWMSWLEPRAQGGHALRVAQLQRDHWGPAFTIVEGDSIVANWADFPTMLARGSHLVASYLWKTTDDAYEVRLTQSLDGGRTWSAPVVPHRDGTPTEHGFVSLLAAPGGTRAVWLDGRQAVRESAGVTRTLPEGMAEMTLRTATLSSSGTLGDESVLDSRVCDCCQTAAVATPNCVLVAYRDRSAGEIRDIRLTRLEGGRWSEPTPIHEDGWHIPGCPVNGPALAAWGDRVAAVWFTGARDTARVRVAFSTDQGAHFGAPVTVDEGSPLGRVHLTMLPDGDALVGWLEARGKEARFEVRRVAASGAAGPAMTVARASAARASGFPRLARAGDHVVLAWTEAGKPSHVRTAIARIAPAAPAPGAHGR